MTERTHCKTLLFSCSITLVAFPSVWGWSFMIRITWCITLTQTYLHNTVYPMDICTFLVNICTFVHFILFHLNFKLVKTLFTQNIFDIFYCVCFDCYATQQYKFLVCVCAINLFLILISDSDFQYNIKIDLLNIRFINNIF